MAGDDAVSFRQLQLLLCAARGRHLAYTWRTIFVVGTWTSILWVLGIIWLFMQPLADPGFPRGYWRRSEVTANCST